jgi:hypothetical protein
VHLAYKALSFLFLSTALIAPMATRASPAQELVVRHEDGSYTRYYDSHYHDYHNWNDREDHSYRIYLGHRHQQYREFHTISHHHQNDYWKWRHHHPDND